MDLSTLSDCDLMKSLKEALGSERSATLLFLYHLIEIDKRGYFREAGYSSLYDFCTRGLHLSEGSAYRRITAARAIREHPELSELFLDGSVSLCSIAASAKAIKEETTTVTDIVGKSKREVEMLVAVPESIKPRERIRPVLLKYVVPKSSEPKTLPDVPSLEAAGLESQGLEATEEKQEEIREERFELRFSVTKEVFEEFKALRDELSNKLGTNLSLEAVFSEVVHAQRTRKLQRSRISAPRNKKDSRRIPAALRREVFERDNHQCTYCAEDGTRCTERRYLQFDHIVPFAKGGSSDASNIRLLCHSHNALSAEKIFGKDKVEFYTNSPSTGGLGAAHGKAIGVRATIARDAKHGLVPRHELEGGLATVARWEATAGITGITGPDLSTLFQSA